jgi:peptidoglycan/LPS O-acetylase OafA/YrhL
MNHDRSAGLLPDRVLEAPRVADRSEPLRDSALPFRPDIDGLRAVAVGLVIAYHAFPKFLAGGFIGVDVFFVISGYLITRLVLMSLQAGTFSLGEFYRRRVRRIVPALVLVMLACCLFGWLWLLPSELQSLGKSLAWCAPFLANLYFARNGGYFDKAAELNPLLHLWSLGVEEQFYLIWPVLLLLAVKRRMTLRVLIAVAATSLAVSIWGAWHAPRPYFYLPVPRMWELAVGGILAAWQLRVPRAGAAGNPSHRVRFWSGAQLSSLAGLSLICASALLLSSRLAIPGAWSTIPTAGAALLIGAGQLAPVNRLVLGNGPMIFVGRLSYPLYLWHWPLFSFARIILGHPPTPELAIGVILVALVAAYASYRLVELPIRFSAFGRRAIAGLLVALAGLALVGAAMATMWVPGRLSGATFAAWDAAASDWYYPAESNIDKRSGFGSVAVASHRDRYTVFIGDSHIEQYWPRAKRVIDTQPDSARSAIFATNQGCPPLPGIDRTWRGKKCRGFFEHAMKLAVQPNVDTVVFGAFWESYFLGEYSEDESSRPAVAAPPLQLDSADTRAAFEQFRLTVAKLVSGGRRVFIVLSNPTSGLFVPSFPPELRLSLRPPPLRLATIGPRVDVSTFESFVAPLTERLRSIAAQTGATTVDPLVTLCAGLLCPSTGADGLPLYVDSNHLRSSFARDRALFVDEMLLGPESQPPSVPPL